MKRLLLAALLLAALVTWALWPASSGPAAPSITERAKQGGPQAGAVSAQVISGEDLPPAGTRSLFDHFLAQNDGLPYPFEKLAALVQRHDAEARPPVRVLIPLGRSLLKAQADFARPRLLLAADYQAPATDAALGPAPRGQLFFGFVEQANEIEVISYNEAAGRFEFQLVQDYRAGGVPRIVYARRAVCTTCHQGAAPIFPQRPWNETNAQPEIAGHIRAARGDEPYMGVPPALPLAAPERFDELTDVGNFIPVTQRTWLDGCGAQGRACRRQLLKVALQYAWNPGAFDAQSVDARRLRELQAQSWPAEGIAVPESDIRNRDPLAEQRGVRGFFRTLFTPKSVEPGARSNEDLSSFERLPKLPQPLDPLTPRPPKRVLTAADLDGAFGIAQLFSVPDVKLLEQAARFELPLLLRAVDRLPDAFFDAAPFARAKTVNALLQAFGRPPRAYAFLDTSQMSPPIALGVPPLALARDSPLKPYEQYCFACHRGNPAARLDFMAGKDEGEVRANLEARPEVRDALDWERYRGTAKESALMPPADSHQRAALEQALAQHPTLLEEMRKVVPGMFDF